MRAPSPHTFVGPFRLIRQLGRGGSAPVWLAHEIHEGRKLRDVAIKLFFLPGNAPPESSAARRWRERILDEAHALCRVEHPNIVRLYSILRDDSIDGVGLVMEYVSGKSLDVLLAEVDRVDVRTALDAGVAVAWALSAVHQAGLVHRDVKPANIVKGASGYKLIDFGIHAHSEGTANAESRLAWPQRAAAPAPDGRGDAAEQTARERAGTLVGTAGYIAPECVERNAPPTPASDLYALGVTLHRLLGGMPRLGAGISLAGVPVELAALLSRLVDPDPAIRPHHAEWVARELERLRGQLDPDEVASSSAHGRREPIPAASLAALGSASALLRAVPPLVGRDEELSWLDAAAAEARRGHVRFVLLSGPLGVGRTRLLEAVIDRSSAAGVRALHVRCSPERRSPLRPLVRAVEALPDAEIRGLRVLQDALDRALSPVGLRAPGDEEDALEGVEDALLWASASAPILLAIDDVQWGDAYTLHLLRLLVERARTGGAGCLLVVAATRDEPYPSPPLRSLLDAVRPGPGAAVRRLRLGPLPPAEAAALARAVGPVVPELEAIVVRGAGGVPFFIVHALFAWFEAGAVALREGRLHPADERALRGEVPGVAELLQSRLTACFPEECSRSSTALRALATVALYGGGLAEGPLCRVAGVNAEVEEALQALVETGILVVSSHSREYGFAQEMVRQAMLNLARHRPWFHRVHRALLDDLAAHEGADADPRFLAAGYDRLGDTERARAWTARAVDASLAAGLFEEAAALGDRLVALSPDPGARAALELDVAQALLRGRSFEAAGHHIERAEAALRALGEAADPAQELRRRIYRLYAARGLRERGAWDASLLPDADAHGDLTLRCEARMALAGVALGELALDLAGDAVALAERASPPLEFAARVLRAELGYASNQCDLRLCEEDLRRALEIAAATSSTWRQVHIEGDLAVIEADLGRVGAAVHRLRRLAQQAEARGMRGQLRLLLLSLSAFLLRDDCAAEAAATAGRAAALAAEAGDSALRSSALSVRAAALRQAGDAAAALESADDAVRLHRERGDWVLALTLLRRAEILKELGRNDEALEDARRARQVAEEHGERDLAIRSMLWCEMQSARGGASAPEDLARALAEAEAAPITLRRPTRDLIDHVKAWLSRPARPAAP